MARPLIIDSFAGGGGASTGIEMALGRSPDFAINHNPVALAMHAANHPDTVHLSENIYKVDPLDYIAGQHVGLAWFSPDCKHFSKAKGGKPVERNVRDLAWIIPGWVERIQKSRGKIDVVILENVEEFKDWGPLVETDKGLMPCPNGRGQTFAKWCAKLKKLAGRLEWRELRACDFGAPTIRKRLFIIIRFDDKKIVWPAPTHGAPNDPDVLAGRKLPWRAAAEIIDWSLPCPSIFDSAPQIMEKFGLRAIRPLADATGSRIARGVKRYVLDAAKPFLVVCNHQGDGFRGQGLDEPMNTITAARDAVGVVTPSLVSIAHGDSGGRREYPVTDPYGVVTAGGISHAVVSPVLTYAQHGGANRSLEQPAHTITASAKDQNAVIVPTLVQTGYGERAGQSPRALDPHSPLGTIVAGGVKHAAASVFLAQHNNDARRDGGVNPGRSADEPVSTITANPQQGVIAASLMSLKGSDRRARPVDAPHPAILAGGGHSAVVAPHLMTMRNAQKPFNGVDEPTHTITAGGAGLTLVSPFMQKYYGTGDGATMDDPAPTVTTRDRFGLVEALAALPPFTPDQEARAREVADFLRAHGVWDEREFVTLEISGVTCIMVDIGMRMLVPRELFNAQSFPTDYIIEFLYLGKPLPKSAQVSSCGNSVSPVVAAALAGANCPDLIEYREAAE